MAEHEHHHHHHHRKDGSSRFKEKSLNAIESRKKMEKIIKTVLTVIAIIMGLAVMVLYTFM